MKIDASQPIGKFAAGLPGAMRVFEAYGIDYANLCDHSLDDAAHAEGIAPDAVIGALRRLDGAETRVSWSDQSLTELTRHLVQQHHHFVRHELGKVAMHLSDLCEQEEVLLDLLTLRAAFVRLTEIVLPHLSHEESGVFRAVETMEKTWQSGEPVDAPANWNATLRQVAAEHGAIAAELRAMRELRQRLADEGALPQRGKTLCDELEALEAHLHEYMFLENWIVLPRAAALAETPPESALTHR